jgi:hypothetical protein
MSLSAAHCNFRFQRFALAGVFRWGGCAAGDIDGRPRPADSGGGCDQPPSAIVIVITTLAIAALFNPLRRRVQDFIDRRFYRRKYDAAKTLAAFAATAREEVDLDALTVEFLRVVDETMQPTHILLWLKPTADHRQYMLGEN